jgi:hypothetical protein
VNNNKKHDAGYAGVHGFVFNQTRLQFYSDAFVLILEDITELCEEKYIYFQINILSILTYQTAYTPVYGFKNF